MLEADNVSFRIAGSELVRDITTRLSPGKLHLLVGPNGAGKSTLVQLLAGTLRPSSGVVRYAGRNAQTLGFASLAKERAVLSQSIEAAFPLSVREVVAMGRYPHFGRHPAVEDRAICDEVMAFFEVGGLAERSYSTLSGGERQRVNFARVLAQVWRPLDRCRYLLLDEPLTFLDIRHQLDFMNKVQEFSRQEDVVTVGVVHDLSLAARYADEVLVIAEGRLLAQGKNREALSPERIRQVFAVEPKILEDTAGDFHLVFR